MFTFFRVIGILICLLVMVGFGICGVIGVVNGISGGLGSLGVVFGLVGIAISAGAFLSVRILFKDGKSNN